MSQAAVAVFMLLTGAALCLSAGEASARPRKGRRPPPSSAAASAGADVHDQDAEPDLPVYPGAKPSAKAAERFLEENEADQVWAYRVPASHAKTVAFYRSKMPDPTLESESENLFLIGKDDWNVRVEKAGTGGCVLFIFLKEGSFSGEASDGDGRRKKKRRVKMKEADYRKMVDDGAWNAMGAGKRMREDGFSNEAILRTLGSRGLSPEFAEEPKEYRQEDAPEEDSSPEDSGPR